MPFTFAHPAIVLPFGLIKKKWFSMTGLIVGSMSPDFEYFFRMHIRSDFSHTIPGLFYFDLPASLLIALIFHQVIKQALIINLPSFLSARFQIFATENWLQYFKYNYFTVIISVIIGAASHIFWDGFTHVDGHFVLHMPLLQKIGFDNIPVYKILQHSSTALGLMAILLLIFSLPKSKIKIASKSILPYWLITLVVTCLILAIFFLIQHKEAKFGNVLVASISAGFISLMVSSWWYKGYKFQSLPNQNQ